MLCCCWVFYPNKCSRSVYGSSAPPLAVFTLTHTNNLSPLPEQCAAMCALAHTCMCTTFMCLTHTCIHHSSCVSWENQTVQRKRTLGLHWIGIVLLFCTLQRGRWGELGPSIMESGKALKGERAPTVHLLLTNQTEATFFRWIRTV